MWLPQPCFPGAPGTSGSHLRSAGSAAPGPGLSACPCSHRRRPSSRRGRRSRAPGPCGLSRSRCGRAGRWWPLRGLRVLVTVSEVSAGPGPSAPLGALGAGRDPRAGCGAAPREPGAAPGTGNAEPRSLLLCRDPRAQRWPWGQRGRFALRLGAGPGCSSGRFGWCWGEFG